LHYVFIRIQWFSFLARKEETNVCRKQWLWCALFVLGITSSVSAQERELGSGPSSSQFIPAFKSGRARLLAGVLIGSDAPLGYKSPSIDFSPGIEAPIGNHLELQGYAFYSPTSLNSASTSKEFDGSSTVLIWITNSFGITGTYSHSSLWTPQYDKQGSNYWVGAAFRDDLAYPGRTFIRIEPPLRTGCVDRTTPACIIQSNRQDGIEAIQEFQVLSHLRLGVDTEVIHLHDQGAWQDPSAPRHNHTGWTAHVSATFVWPRVNTDVPY
jgi:hypothetical protein